MDIKIKEEFSDYLKSKEDAEKFVNELVEKEMYKENYFNKCTEEPPKGGEESVSKEPVVKPPVKAVSKSSMMEEKNKTKVVVIFASVLVFIIFIIVIVALSTNNGTSTPQSLDTDTDSAWVDYDVVTTPKVEKPKINTDSIVKVYRKDFTFRKDEFSSDGRIWVEPKNKPKYINTNSVYLYFQMVDDVASNLRLVIQYTADDWLFIQKYIFNCDGLNIEYIPEDVERDNNSNIWEWSDQQMSKYESSLIGSICSSKNIKVKFFGRQYNKVRTLSQNEINYMKKTIKFYRELGGKMN